MKKFRNNWFRVAVEGATSDKRTIKRSWLEQAAKNFNPSTYCARLWLEHFRSLLPDSPFKAYGDVPRYAVGHSFGGVLTSLIVAERPQLFAKAVMLDPVIFSPSMISSLRLLSALGLNRRHTLARKAAARRQHWPDRASAKAALANRGIFKGWSDEALNAYVEHGLKDDGQGVALKCSPEREVDIFSSFPRRLWRSLRRVQTPTLVIHGRDSYPYVARSIKRWAALNRHLSTQVIDGQHCFMQVDPVTSARSIAGFLQTEAH